MFLNRFVESGLLEESYGSDCYVCLLHTRLYMALTVSYYDNSL